MTGWVIITIKMNGGVQNMSYWLCFLKSVLPLAYFFFLTEKMLSSDLI